MKLTINQKHGFCSFLEYTNLDLYRISGHVTQAKADLWGTWVYLSRCTWQIQLRSGQHISVFCTDLNLFYSIHFPFLFLCGFGWGICGALCHCPLWSEWGWSSDNQISYHALLRCSWVTLSGNYATGLVKLKDKMDENLNGGFQYKSQVIFFCFYTCE